MASNEGWIKVHRKTLHCEVVMKSSTSFAIWMYVLLQASHKEIEATFGAQKIMLQPGQFITGYQKIATDLKCNKTETYRILKRYENETMIEIQSCSKGVLISVLNWDLYQTNETENETEMKQFCNENVTKVDTNKNIRRKKKEINTIEDTSPVFIELPLNDGTMHKVTDAKVNDYKTLYPSVDVEQELRNMRGWCDSNRTKRKTKSGVERFITSWLAREQNKPHKVVTTKGNSFTQIERQSYDMDALEKMLEGN